MSSSKPSLMTTLASTSVPSSASLTATSTSSWWGNALWQKQTKVNAELFALTYGAMVGELMRDLEKTDKIQEELDRMGHSIGIRCIEEFLAKSSASAASAAAASSSTSASAELGGGGGGGFVGFTSGGAAAAAAAAAGVGGGMGFWKSPRFIDTAELVKASLKMFLGINTEANYLASSDSTTTGTTTASLSSYTITLLDHNPLTMFVELPPDRSDLEYSQLLCGMVRGMLEMLQYDVTCQMIQSQLKGHDVNEMRVDLKQVLQEGAGDDYHEE